MATYSGIGCYEDVIAMEAAGAPELPNSTYELIKQGAARNSLAPALTFFLHVDEHKNPETWSYQALLENIHQTANFLHSIGADKETVIAYILPNLPETHFIIWGGQATGIVAAINPLLEPDAIADLLNAAGASILFTLAPFPDSDLFAKVSQILSHVDSIQHLVLVNLCDRVRGERKQVAQELQQQEILRSYGSGPLNRQIPKHIAVHDFADAISTQVKDKLNSARQFSASDYSSFFCTGGTTGAPKIAVRTHGNEVANAWSASQFFGSDVTVPRKVFCGLPLFHVNAVLVTGLLPFSIGGHVILGTPQGYRGEGVISRFWELVEHHQIHSFSGVPTLFANLMQVPIEERNISSLEYALCGAAPMPIEVFRRFQETTGVKILEGYGLTEGTCVSSVNPPHGEQRSGSIGLRIPGQRMKTVLLDEQQRYVRDCDVDEVGVIIISGPNVFSGYKDTVQNQHIWIEMDDNLPWLNTGDLGRQDAQGYFWLTGRKKEIIIRGGHNIDPACIEEVLHQHHAVQLAAAVGRPDPLVGELPVAYVQLKPQASVSVGQLMAFVKEQMVERAAIPKHIHIVDTIPLTVVGKIFKPALRHLEIRNALTSSLRETGLNNFTLKVCEDKTLGITIIVKLDDDSDRERAELVLGLYPFHFSLIETNLDVA